MRLREFERLVAQAISEIPEELLQKLDNVDIVVEDEPDLDTLEELGLDPGHGTLLGLYRGVPLTQRDSRYGLVLPDQICIYKLPIEAQCRSIDQVRIMVKKTVVHEIAHHFGISDDRLYKLGF